MHNKIREKDSNFSLSLVEKSRKRKIFIITGLSGAGRSSVLDSLEDLGFYCIDNPPVPLLSTFLDFIFRANTSLFKSQPLTKVALGIDARGGSFFEDLINELDKIKNKKGWDCEVKVIFLDAQDSTIVKRFQETRRAHPIAQGISIGSAIKKERELLSQIKNIADEIHFTDQSNIHELRRWVRKTFAGGLKQELVVNLISFGFKYGVPTESNLVYDLRFLPNPYFVMHLKKLNGKDRQIQDYLFSKESVNVYWEKLQDFLKYLLNCYCEEGRFSANVSIGCTGGKHRSVAFVERLAKQRWENIKFLAYHRDVGRE